MLRGPVASSIKKKIVDALKPVHLEVLNESHMHHSPPESERYFKIVVVSDKFEGKSLVERHRIVNSLLSTELKTSVHALSIVAHTPIQWDTVRGVVPKTPSCRGGFRADKV